MYNFLSRMYPFHSHSISLAGRVLDRVSPSFNGIWRTITGGNPLPQLHLLLLVSNVSPVGLVSVIEQWCWKEGEAMQEH